MRNCCVITSISVSRFEPLVGWLVCWYGDDAFLVFLKYHKLAALFAIDRYPILTSFLRAFSSYHFRIDLKWALPDNQV